MRLSRPLIVAVLYSAVLIGGFLAGVEPVVLGFFVLSAAYSTWRNRRRRNETQGFWNVVWKLRHAGADERAKLIEELEPVTLRAQVERILSRDGSDERSGDIEQFPFPLSLRRQAAVLYWMMWALAVGLLAASALSSASLVFRVLGVALAAICALVARWASKREVLLQSVVEITPFRISELLPDGVIRTLSWNNYLELRNEPARSRFVLSAGRTDEGIPLDYRRMGFTRLVDRVRTYGKFPSERA